MRWCRWLWAATLLVGCTADEEPTVAAPSARASSTTATVDTTPATLVPGSVPPGPGTAVVVSSLGVLGWWDGERWVRYAPGERVPVLGGEEYTVVRVDEPLRSVVGATLDRGPCSEFSFDGNPGVGLDLGPESVWPTLLEPVAISGVEDPRPRLVSLLAPDAYQVPAREVVEEAGFEPDDAEVVQVVRADLDGDGTDEVIVVVERHNDPSTVTPSLQSSPGDYSVAFLRVASGDEVRTEVLAMDENDSTAASPSPSLLFSRVAAIADLNGDGRMEIVLAQRYYEGSSMVVLEVADDGTTEEVLAIGCGV